jgi:hydroxymethylbilane synthase
MTHLILGSRGSKLAIWQTEYVASQLRNAVPGISLDIKIIKTTGDKILDVSLSRIGDKGLFTKEIEKELLDGSIDMAVHSMKDLPSVLEPGLCIGAVLPRENPADVLLARKGLRFEDLPKSAVIGTSSLRRIAQIRRLRPDIKLVDMRGNVETRIRKMQDEGLDGIVLAYAGVKRLGFEALISDYLDAKMLLPAVGQGAIAVEVRQGDTGNLELLQKINHEATFLATLAERSFLRVLEGGCQVPIGCYSEVHNHQIIIDGLVASLDGQQVFRGTKRGSCEKASQLGEELAADLLQMGATEVLANIQKIGD